MESYNRVYARIDLSNIKHNLSRIKCNIPDDTLIMPVIKADAYGHGAVKVAKEILPLSDFFAVATIEEAIELRRNSIEIPILILGTVSENNFEDAIINGISVNVYTEKMARKLSDIASKLKKDAVIHISLDTGMRRIGAECNDEGIKTIKDIVSYPHIKAEGIFSHFATADEDNKNGAYLQRKKFDLMCKKLSDEGVNFKYRHILNSAGICDLNEKCYDMVRAGIILYGYYPSEYVGKMLDLKMGLSLKTHIAYIKDVEKGEGISYGFTYIADKKMKIATIPVGYADGYPRALSNKGRVIIKGKYAPIVGRVCMDQFMVDITDIDDVSVEDDVTLIGKDGDLFITADDIANLTGTISYEVLCDIGKRVPRIYK